MKKKNLFPIIALTVIGVVVATLLATVNAITAPIIEEREKQAILDSLEDVMPGGDFGSDVKSEPLPKNAPDTVTAIYKEKNGMGHVVTLKTTGYASVISITVGIDADGKITKAVEGAVFGYLRDRFVLLAFYRVQRY